MLAFIALLTMLLAQTPTPVPTPTPTPVSLDDVPLLASCDHPPIPVSEIGGAPVKGNRYPYTLMRVYVDASGKIIGASVVSTSTNKDADDNAMRALLTWKFMPAQSGCRAVSGSATITAGLLDQQLGGGTRVFNEPCLHDAAVMTTRAPDFPQSERGKLHETVVSLVQVSIDEAGRVVRAIVYKSSGYTDIDQSALTSAEQSWFAPKVVACKPVEGDYLMRETFAE